MSKGEFLKRALGGLDTSNAFISTDSEAVAVNPNIWDRHLRDFEEAQLVFTQQCEQIDFRNPGVDYTVTVDDAPSAAAALTETIEVPISAFTTRNVTFTPTEQGAAYQLTRKEAVRAFFNVADRMTRKLGYAMALRKDNLGVTVANAGASNTIFANSKSVASDLASTDTIRYVDITKASRVIEDLYYRPSKLFVNHSQKQQILDLQSVNHADEFGTRDGVAKGLVGELFGLQIYASHSVTSSGNVAYAIVMGESQTGEQAVAYAIKRDPMIETEYHARGRFWDIVGHEEYDFQVIHPGALCLIGTYSA